MAASDVIKLLDSHTNEQVAYYPVTAWVDGTAMDDSKVDNIIYRKKGAAYYRRAFDMVNIQWFGAKGDGITDDTAAIQAAINYTKTLTNLGNPSANNGRSAAFTVYFPPTNGGYLITSTIYIPAFIKVLGDNGGWYFSSTAIVSSKIICNFSNPLMWAFETDVYMADNTRVAYNKFIAGSVYDAGQINACAGIYIEGLNILTAAGTRLFGGIKLTSAPYARVKNVFVSGADFGIALSASWCSTIDATCFTYKCSVFAVYDNNNIKIDGYYSNLSDQSPLDEATAVFSSIFNAFGSGVDFSTGDAGATYKYGIFIYYSNGFRLSRVTCEHNDASIGIFQSTGTIGALYSEGITAVSVISLSSKFSIQSVTGVGGSYFLQAGANCCIDVQHWAQQNTTFIQHVSQYNSKITAPNYVKGSYVAARNIEQGAIYSLYVSSTSGSDANIGNNSAYPLATVTAALARISDVTHRFDNGAAALTPYNISIYILDGSAYTVSAQRIIIENIKLSIFGASGTITFDGSSYSLKNATITCNNCNISITPTLLGGTEEGLFWSHLGANAILLNQCNISIAAGKYLAYGCYNGASALALALYNNIINAADGTSKIYLQNYQTGTGKHALTFTHFGTTVNGSTVTSMISVDNSMVAYRNDILTYGATANRPVLDTSSIGYKYFDTTINRMIEWSGIAWIDPTAPATTSATGVVKKSAALTSAVPVNAAGASPTQAEFNAVVAYLNELVAKQQAAGQQS